jgi:hypothetical protein
MSQSLRHLVQALVLVVPLSLHGAALADTPPACVGDCQGSGTVAISSLIALVGIALGDAPPSSCALGIPSGAPVDVALTVQAVHNALSGCSAPQPTATSTAAPANPFTPTPTPTSIPTRSGACPAGQHRSCHGGSGRGGGYKTTCTCVINPPPVCVTAWGTQIPAGTSLTLYDTNLVHAPDTCGAHATVVSCDANGILAPAGAVGYPLCSVVFDEGD